MNVVRSDLGILGAYGRVRHMTSMAASLIHYRETMWRSSTNSRFEETITDWKITLVLRYTGPPSFRSLQYLYP